MIEIRSDGGDFAELWIDGNPIMDFNSDIHDLETVRWVLMPVAKYLGKEFAISNKYEYDPDTDSLKPVKPLVV